MKNNDVRTAIDSTLFDDLKLMVAYRLKDNANIAEKWQPTEDELQRMEKVPQNTFLIFERQYDIMNELYQNYEAGEPCGMHIAEIQCRGHAYIDDGVLV
jgi:hypothetical protein